MDTIVLPLGTLPTDEGDGFGLLAILPGGFISVDLGTSWADAATRLSAKLQGPVTCDATLATVGRRFGWKTATPSVPQLLDRAAISLALSEELPPKHHDVLVAFARAWADFFRLRLWEQMPAEMSLRALWKRGGKTTETAIAVMGQAGIEYGLAFYEDPRTFDAIWSGEKYPMDGLSVLASDEPFLEPAFQSLGVPPPVVTSVSRSRARRPKPADFVLATAVMRLLVNVLTGELAPLPLGAGATIELKRDVPKSKSKSKSKRAVTKRPAAKKKVATKTPTRKA